MTTIRRPAFLAAACLLFGIFIGVAGAQVVKPLAAHYLNSGLFSVSPGEGARFRVALDDHQNAPPANVMLQLHDEEGSVLAQKTITLLPGQSTDLATQQPGVYRAHARVVDPADPPSDRRVTVGSVEIFDIDTLRIRRYLCVGGLGRIPDSPVN